MATAKDYVGPYAAKYKQMKAKQAELDKKRDYHIGLVEKYNRLAEEHQKKADKVPHYGKTHASWLDVLNALCDDVSEIVGYPHDKAELVSGLRRETYVSWTDGDPKKDRHYNVIYSICVTPDEVNPDKGFALSYDTGEHKASCPKGSLGDFNGFNNVTAPLPLDAEKVAEILKDLAAKELKESHNNYNKFRRGGWDGKVFGARYKLDDLALHLLLDNEVFYWRDNSSMGRALTYLQDAYPEATIDDLDRVYDRYSEIVTRIYG